MTLRFFAPGIPAPGGSKTAMRNRHTGKPFVRDACKRNKPWRDTVASFALEAMVGRRPMDGPLSVTFVFILPRPKAHFFDGKKTGQLRPTAPNYHSVRPDTTKLIRSTEDALTGLVWTDDAVISEQRASKVYADSYPGTSNPGVIIEVDELEA